MRTKSFSFLMLFLFIIACTPQKNGTTSIPKSTTGSEVFIGGHGNGGGNGGGIDPGGGKFIFDSRDEVIKTVNGIWEELTSSDLKNPILVAYMKLDHTGNKSPEQQHIFVMLQKILWGDEKLPRIFELDDKGQFPATRLARLKEKKIRFANSDCDGQKDKDDPFMAVTRFDFDGDICVNLQTMMTSFTSSSKFDVMALMVHEIAHLAGYQHAPANASEEANKDDLMRVQRFFVKYAIIFYRLDGLTARGNYALEVSQEARFWSVGLSFACPIDKEAIARSYANTMNFQSLLSRLPNPEQDAELQIARPDLYPNAKQKLQNVLARGHDFVLDWFGGPHKPGLKMDAGAKMSNPDGKPQAWNEKLQQDVAEGTLAALDAELAVDQYLFGDEMTKRSLPQFPTIDRQSFLNDLKKPVAPADSDLCDFDAYNELMAIDAKHWGPEKFVDKEGLPQE